MRNPLGLDLLYELQAALEKGREQFFHDGNASLKIFDDADDVAETIYAASQIAFNSYRAVAVLIGQRVIGFKDWRK